MATDSAPTNPTHADPTDGVPEPTARPQLRQTVLDCERPRDLAEFYRRLLGFVYRPGDEPPDPGTADPKGGDWLVLRNPAGGPGLAFHAVPTLPPPTWPDPTRPQMLHLDLSVPGPAEFAASDRQARAMGARLLFDRSHDPDEPLRVYADPAGHPFCIFTAPPP
jgi:catechol 2,3-dioxygenase-like lactoylglutathione lyase family enzyme